jgi:hypothetical protein
LLWTGTKAEDSQVLIYILAKRHIFSKFVCEKRKTSGLDFVIDKLTNSIENVVTVIVFLLKSL